MGALLLDKPPGISSARAVAKVKKLLPKGSKVGHTGTLDPLASGLLVLLIGRATRLARYVTDLQKAYIATARFGAISDTLDADGAVTPTGTPMPSEETLRAALPNFTGELLQVPPMASALKKDGVRLYDLHRRGLNIERRARPITVHSFALSHTDPTTRVATFEISCTSGTYVRSLLADLAVSLGTGAYLTALRRTRVGHFSVDKALEPHALTPITIRNRIIPAREVVLHLPAVEIGGEEERVVRNGRVLCRGGVRGSIRVERGGELLAVYRGDGEAARAEVVLCGA